MPVMTVCGLVESDQLGITLAHEHLFCDLWGIYPSYDGILDDERLAAEEVERYLSSGGRTIVDVTSEGLGRNPLALHRLAMKTRAHIVMGAGWYREALYPRQVMELGPNELAERILRDFTTGVDGTQVRPGVIGEIGTERGFITPAQERVFRACARAQHKLGVSIWTHTTHFGELAIEQIDLLEEERVPADRIVISHLGDRYDNRQLLAIAKRGVFLGIDNIGYLDHGYAPDAYRATSVVTLIKEGFLDQILLSGDVCMKTHLRAFGGKGYDYVNRVFVPMLQKEGIGNEETRRMLVDNPARALTIEPSSILLQDSLRGGCGRESV